MEIRDFALQVLMADTLEEKLWQPPKGIFSDEAPGKGMPAPERPGRPMGLQFSQKGGRMRLPKQAELHQAEARAVLLHAFANHELLAVELMALALLKFPDAPRSFRRGLLHTLREEQEHTRLYMDRMAAGGLAFGDLPVNGFFWKSIAGMKTPLDYVSHLSLTFEQANLDYARHYGEMFHRLGDAETGGLLDRIYQDEIAHVGYGLKWFRRWKDPDRADWDAWQETLPFPLSPARAKGNAPFNREGRRQAGLSDQFIEALDLFSHSRGRTPWVGFFNPGAEASALANDAAASQRESSVAALARDLDVLPAFSLNAGDVVIVHSLPRPDFLRRLKEAGAGLPQWEVLGKDGRLSPDSPLRTRRLARLRPWAWSADSAELLGPLLPNAGETAFSHLPWDEEIRSLYAKTTALIPATQLVQDHGFYGETAGIAAGNEQDVAAALRRLAGQGHTRACLKAPFGIAGRGMIQVKTPELSGRDLTWLRPVLQRQGSVVVEPWLERIADFSTQYELTPGEPPRLKGQVRLINDAGGRFLACGAAPAFTRLLPPEAARCLHETGAEELYRAILPKILAALPGLSRLHGNLGVDAFIYRSPDGTPKLRPLVEINPRTTMGRVTLDLRRLVDPSKTCWFRIVHRRAMAGMGFTTLAAYALHLQETDPPEMGETASGSRLVRGQLVLNDAERADSFLGILGIGKMP